jgi:hypothetical protein
MDKAIKEISNKETTGDDDVSGMYSNCWEKMVSN